MIKYISMISLLLCFGFQSLPASAKETSNCPATLNHEVRLLNSNKLIKLCDEYKGKVILIVNTASKCAFTDQYAGLEKLYEKYKSHGLVVLGFPSNNFGNQEPGSEAKVKSFCRLTYGVQFPMFAKSNVQKHNADPLYKVLGELSGDFPSWNFHKYLLDKKGNIVASYSSYTKPFEKMVINQIEDLLY